MRIERLAWLLTAAAIVVAIIVCGPVPLAPGWDKAAHFALFSALTLALWHATAGEMPVFVVAAVIAFGAMDEWRQAYMPGRSSDASDFLANLVAALATAALLFMQRKTVCAESSPR
jgi:VanZ family protein